MQEFECPRTQEFPRPERLSYMKTENRRLPYRDRVIRVSSETRLTRQRLGWYLFDCAVSVLIFNGSLYFPQWLIVDRAAPAAWFNLALVAVTVALVATAPALAFLADIRVGATFIIRLCAGTMFCGTMILWLLGRTAPSRTTALAGIVAFAAILYAYQLSLVFYNGLLTRVSRGSSPGVVSGFGLAAGWSSGILGLLALYPFTQGWIPGFAAGRAGSFLPAALLYGVLVTVSLMLLGGDRPQSRSTEADSAEHRTSAAGFASVYRDIVANLLALVRQPGALPFLLSFFLFSDALLTLENNFPVYVDVVFRLPDAQKIPLFASFFVLAAAGSLTVGYAIEASKTRRGLLVLLLTLTIALSGAAAATHVSAFVALLGVLGVLYGATWNLSRTYYLRFAQADMQSQAFSIYSIFERCASVIGPLVWLIPITFIPIRPAAQYRVSLAAMAALVGASAIALLLFGSDSRDPRSRVETIFSNEG
jgi:MFS transporter, UMF1 family